MIPGELKEQEGSGKRQCSQGNPSVLCCPRLISVCLTCICLNSPFYDLFFPFLIALLHSLHYPIFSPTIPRFLSFPPSECFSLSSKSHVQVFYDPVQPPPLLLLSGPKVLVLKPLCNPIGPSPDSIFVLSLSPTVIAFHPRSFYLLFSIVSISLVIFCSNRK